MDMGRKCGLSPAHMTASSAMPGSRQGRTSWPAVHVAVGVAAGQQRRVHAHRHARMHAGWHGHAGMHGHTDGHARVRHHVHRPGRPAHGAAIGPCTIRRRASPGIAVGGRSRGRMPAGVAGVAVGRGRAAGGAVAVGVALVGSLRFLRQGVGVAAAGRAARAARRRAAGGPRARLRRGLARRAAAVAELRRPGLRGRAGALVGARRVVRGGRSRAREPARARLALQLGQRERDVQRLGPAHLLSRAASHARPSDGSTSFRHASSMSSSAEVTGAGVKLELPSAIMRTASVRFVRLLMTSSCGCMTAGARQRAECAARCEAPLPSRPAGLPGRTSWPCSLSTQRCACCAVRICTKPTCARGARSPSRLQCLGVESGCVAGWVC